MEKVTREKIKEIFFNLFWYFVIFSMVGLMIETFYCYFTTGILESRKGLIWGPFCPIYGVGAAIIIVLLNQYKDNYFKLFFYGAIAGGIIEYVLSYILEAIYGIRFWEYSYLSNNLNGRICMTYSVFWGILSVFLIKGIKPVIDSLISKIPKRSILEKVLLVFFIVNAFITVWGIKTYENRVKNSKEHNEVKNNIITKIEDSYFTNERMLKTFPNLRIVTETGEEIFIKNLI